MPPAKRNGRLYEFGKQPVPAPKPESRTFRLADGTVLATPTPAGPRELAIGDWVLVDGRPHQIKDLRWWRGGGRIVHFHGRIPHPLTPNSTVKRFAFVTNPGAVPACAAEPPPPATGSR
ncbi:hypothetical protein [Kitasatospora griseola]|uniref:hypothetical protein n=1 Tax=Kitasatospora griseola TaxID=2064 RepID=UPI00342CC4BA